MVILYVLERCKNDTNDKRKRYTVKNPSSCFVEDVSIVWCNTISMEKDGAQNQYYTSSNTSKETETEMVWTCLAEQPSTPDGKRRRGHPKETAKNH